MEDRNGFRPQDGAAEGAPAQFLRGKLEQGRPAFEKRTVLVRENELIQLSHSQGTPANLAS